MSSRCYVVLYTNQKTKKAKTWHDGILKLNENATKATLFDDNNSKLDTLFVRDVTVGEQLESDRYYILVEEEKKTSCSSGNTSCTQRTETISHAVSSKPNFTHHTRGIRTGLKRKTTGFNPPRLVKQLKINDDDASKKEHANCIPEAAVKYQADLSPSGFLGLYSKSSGISSLGKSQEENLYPAKSFICEDIVNKNLLSSQASPWTLIGKRSPTTAELSVHHSSPSINNAPDAICSNKFSCNENVQSNLNACASAEDEESANSSKTSNSMNNGSYEKTKRSAADIIALLRGKKKTQDTTLVKTNSEAVFEEKFKIHNADAITKEQEISYSCSNLPSNLLSKSAVSDIKNLNDSRTLSIVQNDATSLCSSKKEDTQGVISSERISALDADQQIDLKDGSETIENTQPIFDPMSVSNTVTKSPVVGSEASSVNHKVLCVEHEDCDKTETENEDMEENVSFKITYSPLSNASYSDGSDFDDLERVDSFSGTPNENGACSNSSVIPDQSISQSNINSRPNICKKTVCQKYSNHETFSDEATMSLVNSCIHSDTKHDNSSARIINPTSFDIDSSSTKDDDIKAETDVSVFPHSGRTDISVPALERSPVVSSGHDSSIINFKTSSLDAQLKSEHGNYLSMLELSPESLSFNISSQESVTSLEKTVVDKTTLPSIPTKSVKNQRRQNFDDDLQFISTHLNTVPCMFSNNQQSVSSDGKFGLKSCTIDNEVEEDLNGDTLTPDTTCINLKQTCRDSKTPKILDVNEISKIHDASGLECCNAGTTHDFSKTGGSEFVISSEEADILITSGKSSEPASQINQSSVKNEKVILNEHNNTSTYTNKDSSPSDNILVESCETCPGNGQYEIVDRDICSSEDFVGSGDISVSNGENNKMLSLPEEIFPMQCDSFSEEKEFAKSDYSKQKFALSTELLSEVPTSDVSECWNMKQVSFTGFLTDNPKEKSRQISEICDRRCDNLPHPDQLRKKNIMSEMKSKYSTEGTEDLFQSADKLSNYKVKGSITSNVVRRNTHSCQITATSGDDLKNNIIMVQAAKLEQTQAENDNFIFNPEQVQSPAQVVYDQDLTHSEDRPFYLDWNNGKPKFMNDHFELEKIEGSPLQKVPQDIVFDSSDQDFAVAFVPNVNGKVEFIEGQQVSKSENKN